MDYQPLCFGLMSDAFNIFWGGNSDREMLSRFFRSIPGALTVHFLSVGPPHP